MLLKLLKRIKQLKNLKILKVNKSIVENLEKEIMSSRNIVEIHQKLNDAIAKFSDEEMDEVAPLKDINQMHAQVKENIEINYLVK